VNSVYGRFDYRFPLFVVTVDHDCRNVVTSTQGVSLLYQAPGDFNESPVARNNVPQVVMFDKIAQSVAAEQETILWFYIDWNDVGLYLRLVTKGLDQNMAHPGVFSLLLRNHPGTHLHIDPGVISGQLDQFIATQSIEAAVAHMSEIKPATIPAHTGQGCAHPITFRVYMSILINSMVGKLDSGLECLFITGCGFSTPTAEQRLEYRLDSQCTGYLSARMSTHAIGYHE
jgi:hypothetical protein